MTNLSERYCWRRRRRRKKKKKNEDDEKKRRIWRKKMTISVKIEAKRKGKRKAKRRKKLLGAAMIRARGTLAVRLRQSWL
jgi:hypothetical protein